MRKLIGLVVMTAVMFGLMTSNVHPKQLDDPEEYVGIVSPKEDGVYTLPEEGEFGVGGFYWGKDRKVYLEIWDSNNKKRVGYVKGCWQDKEAEPPVWYHGVPTNLLPPGTYMFLAILVDDNSDPIPWNQVFNVELIAPGCGVRKCNGDEHSFSRLFSRVFRRESILNEGEIKGASRIN